MKVAKIKISFSILIWRDSPFSRATIQCDFTVLILYLESMETLRTNGQFLFLKNVILILAQYSTHPWYKCGRYTEIYQRIAYYMYIMLNETVYFFAINIVHNLWQLLPHHIMLSCRSGKIMVEHFEMNANKCGQFALLLWSCGHMRCFVIAVLS